jgi:LacI family transcriptional regulator
MMPGVSTMTEVARRAGVSVTTVSHVVNGTRPVGDETRAAVLGAIREAGLRPDGLARGLRRGGTQTLGVAVSAVSNPYFADVVQGIESEAALHGLTILLTDTREDPGRELRAAHGFSRRRVEGVVLAASPDPTEALAHLDAQAVPTVLVDRMVGEAHDRVGPENVEATVTLVRHLADAGHRRIGFVAGLSGLATTAERLRGYALALRRSGLAHDPALVVEGASDAEPARAGVHSLLALRDPPTGLVVANNHMTIGAMRALREAGLAVPRDIALVAFDDFEWADLFAPRLTTMAQPARESGAEAVRLLVSRLRDPGQPPRAVRLAPQLVHRDSCGCHGPR